MLQAPGRFHSVTPAEGLVALGCAGPGFGAGTAALLLINASEEQPPTPVHAVSPIPWLENKVHAVREVESDAAKASPKVGHTVLKFLKHDLAHRRHELKQAKQYEAQNPRTPHEHNSQGLNAYQEGGLLLGPPVAAAVIGALITSRVRSARHHRKVDAIVSLEAEDGTDRMLSWLNRKPK